MQNIYVNKQNVAYPVEIERYLRLYCPGCIGPDGRIVFRLKKKDNGKLMSAERALDFPKNNFRSTGQLVHRGLLDAFCRRWECDSDLTFTITVIATTVQDDTGYNPRWTYEVKDISEQEKRV